VHAGGSDSGGSSARAAANRCRRQWADLPIAPVQSAGTDNAIYRLGDDMAVRLPRIPRGNGADGEGAPVAAETGPAPAARHSPPHSRKGHPPRATPGIGPSTGGSKARPRPSTGSPTPRQAATDLARFVAALAADRSHGRAQRFRGVPLAMRDDPTRDAIAALHSTLNTGTVTAAWKAAVQAPAIPRSSTPTRRAWASRMTPQQRAGSRPGSGGHVDELRAELAQPAARICVVGLRVRSGFAQPVEVLAGHAVEVGVGDQK
jgi:hypothetical protein